MTKNFLKFYKVIVRVLSLFLLLTLVYIFIVLMIKTNELGFVKSFVALAFLISFTFFTLQHISLKELEGLESKVKKMTIENKIKEDLLKKSNIEEVFAILKNYFKNLNCVLEVFIKDKNEVIPKKNSANKNINQSDLEDVVKCKFGDLECIFIIKSLSNKTDMHEVKNSLENFLPLIETLITIKENRENIEKQQNYLLRINNLIEYSIKISNTLVLEETYMWIIKASSVLFGADSVSILDTSNGKGLYRFLGSKGLDLEKLTEIENKINSPYFGEHIDAIVKTGKINYIPNTNEFPGWAVTSENSKSWLGIPLSDLENNVFIVINIGKDIPNYYTIDDVKFAETFQKTVNIAITKNLLLERYRMDSITDPLTKLYNRREFENRLLYEITQAQRYQTKFTLLLMDLDRFKSLNDTFGHLVGDTFLREFADVLRNSIRASDIAFRIGGDEFAAILTHADKIKAVQIAKRIKSNLSKIDLGVSFKPSVSIGIKEYNNESRDELIIECDKLLYVEKLRSHGS
ncbi:GGDEF domain-containing protein [Caldisericum exile]|uniref:sensor domain-containing diguanylate cyclase n=1 Tax=Caldisericum exile TaxID=693075 RepID=UPI003C77D8D1